MRKNPLEQTIIHALSKPFNDPLVKKCLTLLGDYQTIENPHDDSLLFYNKNSNMKLVFNKHDILVKVELLDNILDNATLKKLLQKYHNRQEIYQQLGEPKITQKSLLVYDLKTYWMRFDLLEDITQKIVYLALSTIGKGYRDKEIVLRTCKSSGKR